MKAISAPLLNTTSLSDVQLREQYFPSKLLTRVDDLGDDSLQNNFPVRYELFKRAKTGCSLFDRNLIHISDDSLPTLNRLQNFLQNHWSGSDVVLREGQVPVFQSLTNFYERGLTSGFVVVPTRGGKTVIFVKLLEQLQQKSLVLVPTKELLKQTLDNFRTFAPKLDVSAHYGEVKDGLDHSVVLTTYAAWLELHKRTLIKPGQFELIILDEGHEALGPRRKEFLKSYLDQDTVIAFTATDKYDDDEKNLRRLLKNEIHRMTIREAVMLELISPFSVVTAETEIDLTSVRTDFIKGNFNRKDLARVLNNPSLTQSAINLYKADYNGETGIIACAGVTHANAVAKAFRDAGISARAFHGELSSDQRKRAIKDHKSGKVKILTYAQLLGAGYDNPLVYFTFNLVSTMSLRVATQRGGRPLTINPDDPNKIGRIVEFLHQDQSKRRKQMTYVDAALAAFIPAPKKTGVSFMQNKRKSLNLDLDGLKVSTTAEEAIEVVQSRGENSRTINRIKRHPSDKFNMAVKSIHNERHKTIMQLGMSTLYLAETYELRKHNVDPNCLGLIKEASTQAQERYMRIVSQSMLAKHTAFLTDENRELLLHVERKFRGHGLTYEDFGQLYLRIVKLADELTSVFDRLNNSYLKNKQISAVNLLRHFDERFRDYKLPGDELRSAFSVNTLSKLQREVKSILQNEIKSIEDQALTRWDLFYEVLVELQKFHGGMLEYREPFYNIVNDIIDEVVVDFEGRTLSREDLKQEAWITGIALIDHFLKEGFRNRFYKRAKRELTEALMNACEAADQCSLNMSESAQVLRAKALLAGDVEIDISHKKQLKKERAALVLLSRFDKPISFFSELNIPCDNDGDEIIEQDFDPEDSLVLFEECFYQKQDQFQEYSTTNAESFAMKILEAAYVNGAIDRREGKIIALRYGLFGASQPATLEETGDKFGLTRERIRQIEIKAINKIQNYIAKTGIDQG